MTSSQGGETESTVVEVEFSVSDPQYPLVAVSEKTDCQVELVQLLPRSGASYTIFYRVTGASLEHVLEAVDNYEGIKSRIVSDSDEDAIVEVQISEMGDFFAICLTDAGAIPTKLDSYDGTAHIVAEIPAMNSASEVITQFQEAYPSAEIIARRQKSYSVPLFHQQAFHETIISLLTPRQHEALLLAYTNGFYTWPREMTGEELAAEMNVSPPTFHEHLRSAEKKILALIFTE